MINPVELMTGANGVQASAGMALRHSYKFALSVGGKRNLAGIWTCTTREIKCG